VYSIYPKLNLKSIILLALSCQTQN